MVADAAASTVSFAIDGVFGCVGDELLIDLFCSPRRTAISPAPYEVVRAPCCSTYFGGLFEFVLLNGRRKLAVCSLYGMQHPVLINRLGFMDEERNTHTKHEDCYHTRNRDVLACLDVVFFFVNRHPFLIHVAAFDNLLFQALPV